MSKPNRKVHSTKELFETSPHAAQTVYEITNSGDCEELPAPHNESLIAVVDEEDNRIVFTGEELTDLARKWLKLK